MELDYEQLIRQRATAILASGMSILLAFAMGRPAGSIPCGSRFAPHGIGSIPFYFSWKSPPVSRFGVAADSRRAAWILQGTALGTTAILCAAVDDVVAWTLLAFALALTGGEQDAPSSLLCCASADCSFYLFLMIAVLRPLAAYLVRRLKTPPILTLELLGVVVAGALLSAAATDKIGVHPLFGAFLAGDVLPPRSPMAARLA